MPTVCRNFTFSSRAIAALRPPPPPVSPFSAPGLSWPARVVGAGADFIVLELGVQCTEVEFMVDQVVQREGKADGDDLFRQDHGQQQATAPALQLQPQRCPQGGAW